MIYSCLFSALSWGKIHRYKDVMDKGWTHQEATITRILFAGLLPASMAIFAAWKIIWE